MTDRAQETEILENFRTLDNENRKILLKFARFLNFEAPEKPRLKPVAEPRKISRPTSESVVSAVKRLRKTYPMLEADMLMNEVAEQMTAHLIKGKQAAIAIDELEVIFKRKYLETKND